MDWKKALAFGVALWILMFAVVSVFLAFNLYGFSLAKLMVVLIAGAIVYVLAGYVKPASAGQALGYGLVWVIVGLILDYLITYRFNSQIFLMRTLWLGYLLVLIVPWLRVKKAP